MTSVTTTGKDISGLLDFSKLQLAQRVNTITTLEDQANHLVEAIAKAMSQQKMTIQVGSGGLLTLVFDVPPDSASGLPAVKGNLLLKSQFSNSGISISSAEFIGVAPDSDIHLLFEGKLSYQLGTGLLTGKVTGATISTSDGAKSLVMTGAFG